MTIFDTIFYCCLLLTAGVTFRSSDLWKTYVLKQNVVENKEDAPTKKKWVNLLWRYLLVYLLAALSGWLQGPYVYALYQDYGYAQHDIAVLFVAGFGSSMVFGTFIGGMADQFGRRLFVIVYGLTYAASCFTKRKFESVDFDAWALSCRCRSHYCLLFLDYSQISRISTFS